MRRYIGYYIKNFDYPLFITYVFLCLFRLIMIYSSSMMVAIVHEGETPDFFYRKQLINLLVASVPFLIGAFLPYKHFSNKKLMVTMTFGMIFILIWLWIFGFGFEETGSKSWLDLGFMSFQPSEIAKLFVILYFAGAFYRKSLNNPLENLQPNNIIYPILVWIFVLFCVANEPDIGAVIILSGIAPAVIAASGMSFKSYIKFFSVFAVLGGLLLLFIILVKGDKIFTENRLGRLKVFLNPFEYETGSGYQIINGYIAIGAGGLDGVGLGQSVQKLGYLPEPHNDFIMAIIAEELGVLGVIIVLAGLGFIVFRGLSIAMKTNDPLARMIAAGISSWIAIQTFINLGGVSGLIPLTGVTLPFISYGGSSIIMLSLSMGILLNVSMYVKLETKKNLRGG